MEITHKDNVITIKIPCGPEDIEKAPVSKTSGKNKNVASTGGFTMVPGRPDLKLQLSLITPVK